MGPGPEPGWLVAAVGVGLTVLGWYQISGQPTEAQQLPYLASATIPGAALIVAGTVMVAARRIADAAGRAVGRGGLWALPDGSYVHRADCPLIDGKPEAFQVAGEGAGSGAAESGAAGSGAAESGTAEPGAGPRRPCPICDPDLELLAPPGASAPGLFAPGPLAPGTAAPDPAAPDSPERG